MAARSETPAGSPNSLERRAGARSRWTGTSAIFPAPPCRRITSPKVSGKSWLSMEPDSMHLARPLLGTFVEIAVDDSASSKTEAAIEQAFGAIARVHRLMSFHDPLSDISRLNREASAGAVAVDRWTYQV